jgi:hypothetical protein
MRMVPFSSTYLLKFHPEKNHRLKMGECHRTRQLAELGDYLVNIDKVRREFCLIPDYISSNAILRETIDRRWVSVIKLDSLLS